MNFVRSTVNTQSIQSYKYY